MRIDINKKILKYGLVVLSFSRLIFREGLDFSFVWCIGMVELIGIVINIYFFV